MIVVQGIQSKIINQKKWTFQFKLMLLLAIFAGLLYYDI